MLSALGDQVLLVGGGGSTGRRAVVRERGQEAGQVCRGRRQVDRGAGVVEFGDVPVLGDGLGVAAPGPADGLQGEAVRSEDRRGVQTCALPISPRSVTRSSWSGAAGAPDGGRSSVSAARRRGRSAGAAVRWTGVPASSSSATCQFLGTDSPSPPRARRTVFRVRR